MKFEDLQCIWDSQNEETVFAFDQATLNREVQSKHAKLRRKLLIRDSIEITAGFLCVAVFTTAGIYRATQSLLSGIPLFLAATLILFVCLCFFRGRKEQKLIETQFDDSLIGEIDKVIAQLNYQAKFLKSVLWWYLLPCGAAAMLANFSLYNKNGSIKDHLEYFVLLVVLYSFIYWLNQRAVTKKILPKKQSLESLRSKLTDPNNYQ
ncbi:hypothetical protein MLD52_02525 [Puniceicoccaceae bacterium K14]|nr:hypothetical protein [Puniceicoccaceae bacterium K14]